MKDKIPFYNIVNMFFVGSVFTFHIGMLFHKQLDSVDLSSPFFAFAKDWSVVVSSVLLIAMYEIGFILNRASSVIIEPILTRTKIWPKNQYDKDISEISKDNPKFQSMITDLVLMRTHIFLYFIAAVLSLFSAYKWVAIACSILIVIFVLAGRKHNAKINKIRSSTKEEKECADGISKNNK